MEIQNFSRHHINAVVKMETINQSWKFSGFYGHPEVGKRKEAWNLLCHLRSFTPTAWLCVGDFNETVNDSEKYGEFRKPMRQMVDFQDTLETCRLHDLGYSGAKFTWSNGREGNHFIQERLDRALGNDEWRDMFPESQVEVLAARSSDHAPLLVVCRNRVDHDRRNLYPFRYERGWGKQKNQRDVIKKV